MTTRKPSVTLEQLSELVRQFCEAREWDQFHGAKDLAIGISTESAELLEHFRFKSDSEIVEIFSTPRKKEQISEELADILFFLLRFAQKNDISLAASFSRKLNKNKRKYPIRLSKGKNQKYTEYGE